MNSKSTFFDDDIIDDCISFNHDGIGTASYVEKWNERFEKNIDQIELHLRTINQTLGNRRSFDASLNEKRLTDAVCFRRLHIAIEQDLKRSICIENNVIKQYQNEKENKIITNSSMENDKNLDNDWIDCSDMFNMIFDKYGNSLEHAGMEWLRFVPVKDGKILHKHFLVEGDAAVKINIARCFT